MTIKKDVQGEQPTFEKGKLITQAQTIFKQPPEVVAGALYDITKPITIDQAKEKVNDFLTRPIKNGKGGK